MGTTPKPRTTVLVGDLGGTKCRFAVVDAEFGVHGVQQLATVREQSSLLSSIDAAIAKVLASLPPGVAAPTACGIGAAGTILPDASTAYRTPNLPFDDFPLGAHVQQHFGLPTTVVNDGRASALGEYVRGHARGLDPLLCLFFGTGVGIGLIADGKPFAGADNAAGEIGHLLHVPGGRRCACGGLGHYEAYCGGRAITERAAAEIGLRQDNKPWTVGAVAAHGSTTANAILADAETAATALVANACTLLNPRAIVLGGGLLDGWPQLRERIEAFVRAHCQPRITQALRIVPSLGGSDAILWGAAAATGALFARTAN